MFAQPVAFQLLTHDLLDLPTHSIVQDHVTQSDLWSFKLNQTLKITPWAREWNCY